MLLCVIMQTHTVSHLPRACEPLCGLFHLPYAIIVCNSVRPPFSRPLTSTKLSESAPANAPQVTAHQLMLRRRQEVDACSAHVMIRLSTSGRFVFWNANDMFRTRVRALHALSSSPHNKVIKTPVSVCCGGHIVSCSLLFAVAACAAAVRAYRGGRGLHDMTSQAALAHHAATGISTIIPLINARCLHRRVQLQWSQTLSQPAAAPRSCQQLMHANRIVHAR
jgi:hypothetical protein